MKDSPDAKEKTSRRNFAKSVATALVAAPVVSSLGPHAQPPDTITPTLEPIVTPLYSSGNPPVIIDGGSLGVSSPATLERDSDNENMPKEYNYRLFHVGLIVFYYLIILWTIKRTYKKINKLLISKKLVDKEYTDKDFTYVLWDSDIPAAGYWWDTKLANKPSWFDLLLSYLLLTLPLLLMFLVYSLAKNGS